MDNTFIDALKINNIESPFTELFSLLKRYNTLSEGIPTLAYETKELKTMHQHIDNAMDTLLQGLQDVGNIVSLVAKDNQEAIQDLHNIGFFIAAISNLTEALNTLRSDTGYVLRQRKEIDY